MCSILDEQELDDSDDVPQAGNVVCGFISEAEVGVPIGIETGTLLGAGNSSGAISVTCSGTGTGYFSGTGI